MYENLFAKRGLSLERLRVFLEVAEAGGIARAAGDDPVRQSQYSRQLKELAGYYGVELTRRRGRVLELAPAGKRLARVIRESFSALDDFTHACAGEPVRFCLGAGDSLIQWLLLPGLGKLQREFPRVIFRINGMGTREIVSGLQEMSLDFGILRRDAVPRGLKCKAAGEMKFALYVPGPFLHGKKAPALGWALENLPIATQSGDGRFSKGLHGIAAKLGVRLNIVLECQTFTQALCVLRGGGHAAILPQLAGRDLDPSHFATITSPHFQSQARQIAVAWNPRTIHVREMADRLCRSLLEHYRF